MHVLVSLAKRLHTKSYDFGTLQGTTSVHVYPWRTDHVLGWNTLSALPQCFDVTYKSWRRSLQSLLWRAYLLQFSTQGWLQHIQVSLCLSSWWVYGTDSMVLASKFCRQTPNLYNPDVRSVTLIQQVLTNSPLFQPLYKCGICYLLVLINCKNTSYEDEQVAVYLENTYMYIKRTPSLTHWGNN